MHCKVTKDANGELQLGLLAGEKGGELSARRFRLRHYKNVPAKNVVVWVTSAIWITPHSLVWECTRLQSGLLQLCKRSKAVVRHLDNQCGSRSGIKLCVTFDGTYPAPKRFASFPCRKRVNRPEETYVVHDLAVGVFSTSLEVLCRSATAYPSIAKSELGDSGQLPVLMRVGDGQCVSLSTRTAGWRPRQFISLK